MKNTENAPSLFSATIGGYTGDSFSVEKIGDSLLYKYYGHGYKLKATETIVPSYHEWQLLKNAFDKIGVWEWETEYPNSGIVDGTHWHVEIKWGNKNISSHGNNNYPGGEYDSPEFGLFIRAVRKLIGRRKFS